MVGPDVADRLHRRARVHPLGEHDDEVHGSGKVGGLGRSHWDTSVARVVLDPQAVPGDGRQAIPIDIDEHDRAAVLGDAPGKVPAHGTGAHNGERQPGPHPVAASP